MEDVVVARVATNVLSAEAERKARDDLERESGGARLKALADVAALLKQHGEQAAAETLENRLRGLLKKNTEISNTSRLYLRAQTLKSKKRGRRGESCGS